jgi:hypothetical protein
MSSSFAPELSTYNIYERPDQKQCYEHSCLEPHTISFSFKFRLNNNTRS